MSRCRRYGCRKNCCRRRAERKCYESSNSYSESYSKTRKSHSKTPSSTSISRPCQPLWPLFPPFPIVPVPGPVPGPGPVLDGYSEFRAVTAQDITIFNKAIAGIVGTTYTPILVATQVVSGTNYLFIAETTPVTTTSTTRSFSNLKVYVDLQGNVKLISINAY